MSSSQQRPNIQPDSSAGRSYYSHSLHSKVLTVSLIGNQNKYPAQQPTILHQQLAPHIWNAGIPNPSHIGSNTYFQGLIQNLQGQEYIFQPQVNAGSGYVYPAAPPSSSGYPQAFYGAQKPFNALHDGTSFYPVSTNIPYGDLQHAPMIQPPFHLKLNATDNNKQLSHWMESEQDMNQSPHNRTTTSSIDETSPVSNAAKKPRLSAAAQERRR